MQIRETEKQDCGYLFLSDSPAKQGNFSMHHFSICKIGGVGHMLCDPI